jgi:hypothetical protein
MMPSEAVVTTTKILKGVDVRADPGAQPLIASRFGVGVGTAPSTITNSEACQIPPVSGSCTGIVAPAQSTKPFSPVLCS